MKMDLNAKIRKMINEIIRKSQTRLKKENEDLRVI